MDEFLFYFFFVHCLIPIAGWLFDNPISLFYRRHLVSAWVIILFGTAFAFAPRYYFSKELIPQLGIKFNKYLPVTQKRLVIISVAPLFLPTLWCVTVRKCVYGYVL